MLCSLEKSHCARALSAKIEIWHDRLLPLRAGGWYWKMFTLPKQQLAASI